MSISAFAVGGNWPAAALVTPRAPPGETRFAKRQSGNPRGRPSGAKNFKTLLGDALNEPVIVTENGGRRKVTKRQAIITQLVTRSATADWRAIKIRVGGSSEG
jgi:hypothetical protein